MSLGEGSFAAYFLWLVADWRIFVTDCHRTCILWYFWATVWRIIERTGWKIGILQGNLKTKHMYHRDFLESWAHCPYGLLAAHILDFVFLPGRKLLARRSIHQWPRWWLNFAPAMATTNLFLQVTVHFFESEIPDQQLARFSNKHNLPRSCLKGMLTRVKACKNQCFQA